MANIMHNRAVPPKGEISGDMRRFMRVVLLFLIAIMGAIITTAIVSSSVDEMDGSLDVASTDASFAITVDSCYVHVDFAGTSGASYEATSAPGAVGILELDGGVSASNSRSFGERYTDYFCTLNVTLPITFTGDLVVTFNDVFYSSLTVGGGTVNSIELASLQVTAADTNAYVDVRASNLLATNVSVSIGDGSVALDAVDFELAAIETLAAPISVEGYPHAGLDLVSVATASGSVCAVSADGAEDGTVLGVAPASGSLTASTSSGSIYVGLEGGDAAAASSTATGEALSASSQALVAQAIADGVEQLYVTVKGPGAPDGAFVWSTSRLYMLFSPTYLSLSSFTLLAPWTRSVQLHLSPPECPAGDAAVTFDNLDPLDALIVAAVGNSDGFLFFQEAQADDAARLMVATEPFTGVRYLEKVRWSQYPDELAVLVLVSILTFTSALFFGYTLHKKMMTWRRTYLERFGVLYFGDDWKEREQEVTDLAGPLYMAEFLVGFPSETRTPAAVLKTVGVHLAVVMAPTLPFMVALSVFEHAQEKAHDQSFDWFNEFLTVWMVPYFVFSFFNAMLYYTDVSWSTRRWVGKPFQWVYLAICFWSVTFLVNSAFWLLLGALLKPNEIFPYAGAVVLLVAHCYASSRRVRELIQQLEEEREAQEEALEEAAVGDTEMIENPMNSAAAAAADDDDGDDDDEQKDGDELALKKPVPTATATGKLTLKDSINILSQTAVFEISAVSLKEQLFKELYVSVALVAMFLFILEGFTAFGNQTGLSSALSTGLLFVGSGGVNFPLAMESSAEKRKAWEAKVKAAAKESAAKSV